MNFPLPNSSRTRTKPWLLLIALWLLVSGCVAHREAQRVSNSMIQTSEKANKVVNELKDATIADIQAHQESRRTLDSMHQAWFKSRQALALAQAYSEFLRVSNRVSTDLAKEQAGLSAKIRVLTTNLSVQAETLLRPAAEAAGQLLKKSEEAQQLATKTPDNLRLMKEAAEADRAYALALGRKIEIERNAFRNGVFRLAEMDEQAMSSLASVAAEHWWKIKETYDRGIQDMLTHERTPLNLGPEPISNTNAFTDLADYTAAIGKCGEALQEYFVFNSFGKGSMFDTMLKALAQGAIKSLPIVGNGKGVSWSEAADASTTFFKQATTELKSDLNEAGQTASAALKSAGRQAFQNIIADLEISLRNTPTNLTHTAVNH